MSGMMESLKQAFITVLTFSAYAAVIALAVMAVRTLLGKKLPALFSCALWGIVMLRLLIPVSLPVPPVFDIPQAPAGQNTQMPGIPSAPGSLVDTHTPEFPASRDKSGQSGQGLSAEAGQLEASAEQVGEKPFDLTAWLAFGWAAGFAALTARTAAGYVLTRRRLKAAVPLERAELIKQCAELSNMRCGCGIYLSAACRVPVLFGLLQPRIILPVSAAQMTDEELKHVILHELAHRKRGDMGIKALWSLLLFLNWFNPVLWLADRLLAHDMERACDETVIRILGPQSRKAYALSLLNAALDLNARVGANEALAFAKGGVKHRIENVLNFKKAGKAVMALSLVIVLALGTVLLAACQPTPTLEPVVGRQEDILDSIAQQTPETTSETASETEPQEEPSPSFVFEKIDTPEHITETHNDYEKLNLSIDADVTVPDVSAYPVTEMTRRTFSKDEILSYIKLLAGRNDELYKEWKMSKDDWLVKLTKLKQYKDSGIVYQDWLDTVQKNYDTASETVQNVPVNLDDILSAADQHSQVYVRDIKNRVSQFNFMMGDNIFCYTRDEYQGICPASDYEKYEPNWDTKEHFNWCKPGEPDISQEDAYTEAQKVMDTMNIDLDLYTAEPCSVIVDSTDKTTGWQFVFTRAVSGLQML